VTLCRCTAVTVSATIHNYLAVTVYTYIVATVTVTKCTALTVTVPVCSYMSATVNSCQSICCMHQQAVHVLEVVF